MIIFLSHLIALKNTSAENWETEVSKIYWRIEPKNETEDMYYELELFTGDHTLSIAMNEDGYIYFLYMCIH